MDKWNDLKKAQREAPTPDMDLMRLPAELKESLQAAAADGDADAIALLQQVQ